MAKKDTTIESLQEDYAHLQVENERLQNANNELVKVLQALVVECETTKELKHHSCETNKTDKTIRFRPLDLHNHVLENANNLILKYKA